MATAVNNQAIVQRMLARTRASAAKLAAAAPPTCVGFDVQSFAVTYPNRELMATVELAGAPPDTTVLGVTVLASDRSSSSGVLCMGVAANADGLALPVSVLGASTAPSFPGATPVTGMLVVCFSQNGGEPQECTVERAFTVGG